MENLILVKERSLFLFFAFVFLVEFNLTGQTICNNDIGEQGGFIYEYWKDNGSGCMELGSGGTFSVDWNNINNLLARKGLRPGVTNQTVTYGVNYQPNGNSYLCVYGWTTGPLVEYYIVDSWGSWRPPGSGYMGQVNSDGGTYDIYLTERIQQPSIEGTATFYQFWSVRTSKRTAGTITVENHFNAWASLGMNMGDLFEVSLCIEGYQSSGYADVYALSMGTGSGNNSNGGSSDQGNGEYTVSIRAKGTSGAEHLNVLIDNQVQADINLSPNWQNYEVYVNRGDLNIQYDNDANGRDVEIDFIEVHGETRQAEDMAYNTGVWQNGSCGGSYSQMLHCNGVIGFGDITYGGNNGPNTFNILVRARGVSGAENLSIKSNGMEIDNYNLSTSMSTRVINTAETGGITVEFLNDANGRDVQVDYIEVDGTRLQAENQSTNTGVWQNGSCGGSNSEWLHCSGFIGFQGYADLRSNIDHEKITDLGLRIYPNPVVDMLYVDVPESGDQEFIIKIYNNFGDLVMQERSRERLSILEVRDLASGVYFVELRSMNRKYYRKFIK